MVPRVAAALLASISAGLVAANVDADIRTLSKAPAPGPTLLIVDDAADNDYGSAVALQQVSTWPLAKGTVMTAAAAEVPSAVMSTHASAVVVLHSERSKSPSTVLAKGLDPTQLVDALNAINDDDAERVKLADAKMATTRSSTGVAGALGSAVMDAVPNGGTFVRLSLVIKAGGTVPASRSRFFRQAVFEVLRANGMVSADASPWKLIDRKPGQLAIALYAGHGSDASPGPRAFPKIFNADPGTAFTYVGPTELTQPGLLDQFDVVYFCGGSSNTQGKAIGKGGAEAVRNFVRKGGGYVSSCAGSYLATCTYAGSLHLVNAKAIDNKHWERGIGDVDVEMTDAGRQILGDYPGLFLIHYANGPMLAPADEPGLVPFTPLAYYRSDMAKTAPGGVMPNTPAIISATYGAGRVLCFSPHPEYTEGLQKFIGRAVRWAAKRPVVDGTEK